MPPGLVHRVYAPWLPSVSTLRGYAPWLRAAAVSLRARRRLASAAATLAHVGANPKPKKELIGRASTGGVEAGMALSCGTVCRFAALDEVARIR